LTAARVPSRGGANRSPLAENAYQSDAKKLARVRRADDPGAAGVCSRVRLSAPNQDGAVLREILGAVAVEARCIAHEANVRPEVHLPGADQHHVARAELRPLVLQAGFEIRFADGVAWRQPVDAVCSDRVEQHTANQDRQIFFGAAFGPGAAAKIFVGEEAAKIFPL
jgi:hypothetical protein